MGTKLKLSNDESWDGPTWVAMAAQQPGLLDDDAVTPQNFIEADIGDVIAMEGRNDFTQEWPGRRVFSMLHILYPPNLQSQSQFQLALRENKSK